jgi:competence ComEA-like helix-hairpin-helix protein
MKTNWYEPKSAEQNTERRSGTMCGGGGIDHKLKVMLHWRVNLNKACLEDFTLIEGIGTEEARRIIDYRNQHGLFTTWDELEAMGFGEDLIERIRNQASLSVI